MKISYTKKIRIELSEGEAETLRGILEMASEIKLSDEAEFLLVQLENELSDIL